MAGFGMGKERPEADPTRLGTLETQVMQHLWDFGVSTVADLMAGIPGSPAYTTIATVLNNLRKKRLVNRRKEGRASLYEARLSQAEYTARVVQRTLEASGNREAAMLHFVNGMADEDAELLRQFLRNRGGGAT